MLRLFAPGLQQAASGLEFLANIASGEASGDIVDDLDINKVPVSACLEGRLKRSGPLFIDKPAELKLLTICVIVN